MRARNHRGTPPRVHRRAARSAPLTQATKTPGALRRLAGWWFGGWWHTSRRAFFAPETRALVADLRQLGGQLREDFTGWRGAARRGSAPLTYRAMLAAWGIAPEDVPEVRRMMRVARWKITGITLLAYLALIWQLAREGLASAGYLALVALCALALSANALVLSWRLHCLRIGRYERFLAWIGLRRPTSPR